MSNDPIAYTYDADTHCPPCAEAAFGRCYDGFIACSDSHYGERFRRLDSEGSPVGVIFSWDEWCEATEFGTQYLTCGTCTGIIEQHEHGDPPMYEDDYADYIEDPVELSDLDPRGDVRLAERPAVCTICADIVDRPEYAHPWDGGTAHGICIVTMHDHPESHAEWLDLGGE